MLVINQEPIPDEILQEEFAMIKANFERMGAVSCCERDAEFRGYARENVIARVLLNQEAERRFGSLDEEEVQAALSQIVADHGGPEAFCQKAGITSVDDPLLRQDVLSGLRMDKLLAEVWGDAIKPDEAALRAFYHANIADFLTEEKVRASHIFKLVEKVEDRQRIYDELRAARRRALAGEDFDAMALAMTDKEDKLVDLGYFGRGEFMDEFDLIVFSLEVGELTPVFASHWGFHLAKITGKEERTPKPFEEVKEQVAERLIAEIKQTKTKALVEELKSRAEITDVA